MPSGPASESSGFAETPARSTGQSSPSGSSLTPTATCKTEGMSGCPATWAGWAPDPHSPTSPRGRPPLGAGPADLDFPGLGGSVRQTARMHVELGDTATWAAAAFTGGALVAAVW